jgi:transporter family protein
MSWTVYAFLSALFAGLTALLAKIGVEGISSNAATFIRTCVILLFIAGIVFCRGEGHSLTHLSSKTWLFLVLSGIATGCSWLCYFAALKSGPISHVAPIDKLSFVLAVLLGVIFLREKVNSITAAGIGLIIVGVLLTLPTIQDAAIARFHGGNGNKESIPAAAHAQRPD